MLNWLLSISRDRDRIPVTAILPARLFLGVTFVYAGLQKFTDSQFFSPTAPGFIGHQMNGFVRAGSPLSPLLTGLAIPHAAVFGALIAYCELLIGISALTGLLARIGALGGLAISLTFFLTASWNVHPYFLGPDLPYALGWLTLFLTGPGPYSLDEYFFGKVLRDRAAVAETAAHARRRSRGVSRPLPVAQDLVARAAFVRGLGTAAALAVGGGIVGGIAKAITPETQLAAPATLSGGATAPAASGPAPSGTTLLGNVASLPVNSAGQYTDPTTGDPVLLIHLPDGKFVAYDAVCTHAGCTVEYDPTQHQLACPCHGALFDPTQNGAVLNGPAQQPLTVLQVRIDARGNAYARG